MGGVFEKFQREHDKQIQEETINRILRAAGLLKEGKNVDEVADETGFDENTVRNIKEKFDL